MHKKLAMSNLDIRVKMKDWQIKAEAGADPWGFKLADLEKEIRRYLAALPAK